METIIGLLIVLVPVIFKFIGKKLEQAAQSTSSQAEPIEDWAETLRRHLEAQQSQEQQIEVHPEPSPAPAQAPKKVIEKKTPKNVQKSSPVLQEEVKKKREKIDPKKLIVYSEIMKPKYTE